MGVKGLWQLLLPIGRRISIETLEGKILAVDASIWLTQFLSAMKDPDSGKVRPAAHLIGFFKRLCKLRYQGIRPIFVFDGPTPEIKQREIRERRRRREQFSRDHSGGTIQRMAKQILVQQLKKKGVKLSSRMNPSTNPNDSQRGGDNPTESGEEVGGGSGDTTTTHGAFAPGFYDPEMENSVTENSKMEAVVDKDVIDIIDDKTDFLDLATPQEVNTQSDWDTADVDVVDVDEESKQGADHQGDNPNDIRNYMSTNPDEFDADYVASLPATRRKDFVEEAQRGRRLQSRREFMKVAYNPEELSKCQLRNFLRASKLNQDIHKMAREAAKNDAISNASSTSNRSKRIIFEHDNGSSRDEEGKRKKKEMALQKFRENRKLSLLASSDEEESVGNGKDALEGRSDDNVSNTFKVLVGKRKAIIDDESEEDEVGNGGFLNSPKVATSPSKKHPILTVESDSSDDNDSCGGGFIASSTKKTISGEEEQNRLIDERKMPAQRKNSDETDDVTRTVNDELIARALQEREYGSDDDSGGGGFLPSSSNGTNSVREGKMERDSTQDPARQILSDEGDDEEIASTVNDELIAKALQENEYDSDDGGGFLPSCHRTDSTIEREEIDSTMDIVEHVPPISNKTPIHTASADEEEEDEDDTNDEDVDWEDGNSNDESVEIVAPNISEVDVLDTTRASESDPSCRERNQRDDDHDMTPDSAKNARLKSMEESTATSVNERVDRDRQDATDVENEDTDGMFAWKEKDKDDNNQDVDDPWAFDSPGRSSTRANANDVSAALEQAQKTASNLTNWAGRAFRQAVAKHAAENGLNVPQGISPFTPQKAGTQPTVEPSHDASMRQDRHLGPPSTETSSPPSDQMGVREAGLYSPKQGKSRKVRPVAWPETLGEEALISTLEEFEEKWAEDRNHKAQEIETVTDEMRTEAMNLLQLFGVPYVEAPAEAEAQCVMLERLGLVDGIVTEDSDAFVFGGRRIYKNIFDDQKYVEVYDATDAEAEMNLTRDSLVALAMLLGGDYTEGVRGVGIVNGMEILDAFDVSQDVKIGLDKFRKWLDGFDPFDVLNFVKGGTQEGTLTKERVFHRKHVSARTRWVAPKYFPDPMVLSAYLNPVVDKSPERFSWDLPDVNRLILFCNKHVGWRDQETRSMIQPVMEKIEKRGSMHQTRIESFMRYEDGIKFANVRSKRLRDVFDNVQKQTSTKKKPKASTSNDKVG